MIVQGSSTQIGEPTNPLPHFIGGNQSSVISCKILLILSAWARYLIWGILVIPAGNNHQGIRNSKVLTWVEIKGTPIKDYITLMELSKFYTFKENLVFFVLFSLRIGYLMILQNNKHIYKYRKTCINQIL